MKVKDFIISEDFGLKLLKTPPARRRESSKVDIIIFAL